MASPISQKNRGSLGNEEQVRNYSRNAHPQCITDFAVIVRTVSGGERPRVCDVEGSQHMRD